MEKMLITKLVRTENARAALYAPRHKWPDLNLFDLGLLATVGIDPAELPMGVEFPCMFYALWEFSENLNSEGNPYKDIVALEPAEQARAHDPLRDLARQWQFTNDLLAAYLEHVHGITTPPTPELESVGYQPAPAAPQAGPPPPATQQPPPTETQSQPGPAALLYEDGKAVAKDNDAERSAYLLYIKSHNGAVPASVDALRTWFNSRKGT